MLFCDLEAVISKEMLLSKMSNYRRAGISRRLIGAKVGLLLLFFSLSFATRTYTVEFTMGKKSAAPISNKIH
jgi:hypothetical protein